MSIQPSKPVEVGSPETYKIPVQKTDHISAAWGYPHVQGEWISVTMMKQSMIQKIYQKRYSYKIQSRAFRFFFHLLDLESGFWPGSSLQFQTFNKRTAVLYRKIFCINFAIFPTEIGFFKNTKTCQTFVFRGRTMSKTEGNAFLDFPGQSMQHRQILAKS